MSGLRCRSFLLYRKLRILRSVKLVTVEASLRSRTVFYALNCSVNDLACNFFEFLLSPLDKTLLVLYNNTCNITYVIVKEVIKCRQERNTQRNR